MSDSVRNLLHEKLIALRTEEDPNHESTAFDKELELQMAEDKERAVGES